VILPVLALIGGLALLVWSADRFIDGAVALARRLGAPALLIGMVIVGFGTSAPEMLVSVLGAWHGTPGIALGNAYGSNITNIALILGATALMRPVTVQSGVLRTELPLLAAVTALAVWQSWDGQVTRDGAIVLLCVFAIVLAWMIWQGMRRRGDSLGHEMEQELAAPVMSISRAAIWLVVGLALLIAASRLLVWGAVEIARGAGVSELVIGLTIVAFGTSLPELASSIASARKGEHDIALGNILGSNIFNTLCVVGLAGVIAPMDVGAGALTRDLLVMSGLTAALFVVGVGLRGAGRINRVEGGLLLAAYVGYVGYLVGVSL
jgi:cation:H+ antiporter